MFLLLINSLYFLRKGRKIKKHIWKINETRSMFKVFENAVYVIVKLIEIIK
jgi:hypothetical protein